MTISPLIPLLSAAAPAAGSVAVKAVEALGRLGESISFRTLFGEDAKLSAAQEPSPAKGKGDSLPEQLAALLASAGKSLAGALGRAGVDLSRPIEFEFDRAGGVRLGGDHPQEAEIAATLANDPQALASLAGVFSALPSQSRADPVAGLLEGSRHPQLAQERHPSLSPSRSAASLRLAGGQLSLQ